MPSSFVLGGPQNIKEGSETGEVHGCRKHSTERSGIAVNESSAIYYYSGLLVKIGIYFANYNEGSAETSRLNAVLGFHSP